MLNKITLFLTLSSFASLVLGVVLANREVIPATSGLVLFALGGLIGMIAAIFSVIVLFKEQYIVGMAGMMGLMPMIIVLAMLLGGLQHPRINDVTTNLEDVPAFSHALTLPANQDRNMDFPEAFVPHIKTSYGDLVTLEHSLDPETIFLRLRGSLDKILPLTEVTLADEESGVIEGITTTRAFRWRDDFVIRIRPGADGGTLIDMRSKSRDGQSDFGANANRIRKVFEAIQAMS